MEISYLKEFVVLADLLSYTKAADALFISQPVLSKHIKSLETELDEDLFRRGSRTINLTEFGELYLPYAQKIVSLYEQADNKRSDYISSKRNVAHFGLVEDIHLYEFREYMAAFNKEYPEYRFKLTESFSNNNSELFDQGAYNIFGTAIAPGTTPRFGFIPVASGVMKVLIRKDHPLASGSYVRITDLADETLVLPYRTIYLTFIEPVFENLLPGKKDHIYSTYSTAKAYVESDSYIALLHEEALKDGFPDSLTVLDLEPTIGYTRGIAYREQGLNEAEISFINFAKEYSQKRSI